MPAAAHTRPLTALVHRPGRSMAIAGGATMIVTGGLVLAFQWSTGSGRRWWNLVLMVPAVVGFIALMRTGTTRCEVEMNEQQLVVRSLDSSQLLGRTREATYTWSDVSTASWVGEKSHELRLDFRTRPRALVFSGSRRDLEALHAAATTKRVA